MDNGLTKKQLKKWGVKYHSLMFGKPVFDVYIDGSITKKYLR